ncbi:MAG: hypothetical protein HN704_09715 [Bacteroidetes bacterium]|jgi:hypothetical protein|nr:hypothetical protein [Bacteroidota bacterium]MBT6686824.1 hypothetical protein [Bacteroidota bacterium]MBT7144153.1 hypothetical protein [Bacteroidota bacterium]MBT7491872.1 hypothetical protein [Bacteroidota bacterium]
MKKQILLVSVLVLCFLNGNTQTDPISNNALAKNLFIGIGGVYSSFQDVKYSNVRQGGIGGLFEIGYSNKNEKRFWETGLYVSLSFEKAATHNSEKTNALNPYAYFKYLKPIKNSDFLIGGRIDILDFDLRVNDALGNNGHYYTNGSYLFGSVMHNKQLNDNWNLQSSLDIGLLSFMKESTSFAFSAPQNGLEDGEFNYQNKELESPFGFKYFEFKPIGKIINIKTSFLFQYKERISIGYFWQMKRFSTLKSYPTTKGTHNRI